MLLADYDKLFNFGEDLEGDLEDSLSGFRYLYGYLTSQGCEQLCQWLVKYFGDVSDKSFVDCGSGVGRVVVYMAQYFSKAIGIEISQSRHQKAVGLLKNIDHVVKNRIDLLNSDLFEVNLDHVDVVYLSNLCFSDQMIYRLLEKLSFELKAGCIIVSTKELDCPVFKPLCKRGLSMSWDNTSISYYYEKI